MENEENRRLSHRTVFEDQMVRFFEFNFGVLSQYSLFSHSWSLRVFLVHYIFCRKGMKIKQMRGKERKDQGKQRRIKKLQQEYLQVTFFMCDFIVGLDMHDFACRWHGFSRL